MAEELYFASETISEIKFKIIASQAGIRKILINKKSEEITGVEKVNPKNPHVAKVFKQLREYFNRERREFDLPLDIIGTDFQKKVWNELLKIPYGKTITYNQLAINLGDKKVIRAAAAANGANPIPIIIPCHRVIGSDGNLIGYGGGLDVKQKLLELEGSCSLSLFRKE
ncbi:MAG: methylated-DNA--[protein]-cysteine S-methyltransferase [Ignavibacteriaceae bacterium]|jgi:methylated-DNA-[protein]-cysteine S-methyltransferase|nr:methylated-DNA--[protein]-cysteine S-methyltransferase [Ignavibacteriaceae bacterium]MCW8814158.1 methylated-DNA--[protein]-cysteine S-methyltransferase [Chlorobium sp.]MCW8995271.1 methylated-DNA--[protein]-cysteine S-methyltransferase [Psychromonas sp.]MCW8818498.1 methylated-DNA--[protein]-cysteine S-methyltransferase [Ignavibacteriaceae bacterium]MCW8961589.1 methylated-DNA--[protein]-cysteine S-methyltransferase [Ignavibacteriaceae bacterium]